MTTLLHLHDLKVNFYTYRGVVRALDGVDLAIGRQEALGLVGETGCGKSVTARTIIGLIPSSGRVEGGRIEMEGRDLLSLNPSELRALRGRHISFIFQEPKKALDPTATVGSQMEEAIRCATGVSSREARCLAPGFLADVGLSDTERILQSYSFELSGGMAQRVMIAMAVCGRPKLIIADEPTSALDVSVQAQILRLLQDLQTSCGASLLLITHDLGVAAENCHKIAVMYAGWVVEYGPVETVFGQPAHPYTAMLLKALPAPEKTELLAVPGMVPDLINLPPGCRFANRCDRSDSGCLAGRPSQVELNGGHRVLCRHPAGA
jgi:peptide/nickel transport system ATP-binding protein/oligopeptide transport system ATP-binding protein